MSIIYSILATVSGSADKPACTHKGALMTFWEPLINSCDLTIDWLHEHSFSLLMCGIGILLTIIVAYVISHIVCSAVTNLTAKSRTKIDYKLVKKLHGPIMLLLIATGITGSLGLLSVSAQVHDIIFRIYYAVTLLGILWGVFKVIAVFDGYFKAKVNRTQTNLDNILLNLVRRSLKFLIWILAIFFISQNIFNWNVSALLAGAGVVGLAIAFAAQNTVANIFGAIMIIVDKPFGVGDLITMDGITGFVETVGLRSTTLKSLDGTLWTVPNRQISEASLENITKRKNIKQVFELGLIYGTTPEQMEMALDLVHEILYAKDYFDFEEFAPKIGFSDFKDWSLNIRVMLWFETEDIHQANGWRSELNMEILKRFNEAGLSFAFPTSTHYVINEK